MDVVGTEHDSAAHRWLGPTADSPDISVLVMDPGAGQPTPEWLCLAEIIPVSWLWVSYVDDPLVQARALLERAVDIDATVYVVTSQRAVRTALLVAAHQVDNVGGVFVVVERQEDPGDEDVRRILRDHKVEVWSVPPDSRLMRTTGASRFSLYRPEVVHAVVRELVASGEGMDMASEVTGRAKRDSHFIGELRALAERLRGGGSGWTAAVHKMRPRRPRCP